MASFWRRRNLCWASGSSNCAWLQASWGRREITGRLVVGQRLTAWQKLAVRWCVEVSVMILHIRYLEVSLQAKTNEFVQIIRYTQFLSVPWNLNVSLRVRIQQKVSLRLWGIPVCDGPAISIISTNSRLVLHIVPSSSWQVTEIRR